MALGCEQRRVSVIRTHCKVDGGALGHGQGCE